MADHRIMQQEKPLFVLLFKNKIQTTKIKQRPKRIQWFSVSRRKRESTRMPSQLSLMLVHVAFVVGVGVAAAPFRHVGHALIKVRQRHCILLIDVPLHVCFQQWALIIWKGHGEKGFWIAHKLVDISLSSHLRITWGEKPILTIPRWGGKRKGVKSMVYYEKGCMNKRQKQPIHGSYTYKMKNRNS